jgi:hypothetical protein
LHDKKNAGRSGFHLFLAYIKSRQAINDSHSKQSNPSLWKPTRLLFSQWFVSVI